jgi:maltooligosyltrehalose trehalohydrolase
MDVPDPENRETFEVSKLKWSEVREGKHKEMLAWVRALIQLRQTTHALNDGDIKHMKVAFDAEKRWLTMQRGEVRTLVNMGSETVELEVMDGERLRMQSKDCVEMVEGKVVLPAMSLAVVMAEVR